MNNLPYPKRSRFVTCEDGTRFRRPILHKDGTISFSYFDKLNKKRFWVKNQDFIYFDSFDDLPECEQNRLRIANVTVLPDAGELLEGDAGAEVYFPVGARTIPPQSSFPRPDDTVHIKQETTADKGTLSAIQGDEKDDQ